MKFNKSHSRWIQECKLNEEIDKMLEEDVIEPSRSDYASNMLLVKKPDGSFRPCVDFRRLNSNHRERQISAPKHEHDPK